jgi:outer membrane protein assembly factor BamA
MELLYEFNFVDGHYDVQFFIFVKLLKVFGTSLKFKNLKYLFLLISTSLMISCKQTKYVPKEKYLLTSNKVIIHGNKQLSTSEMNSVIKQQPNSRVIFKFKLAFFNMIDSTKVANKRLKKNQKLQKKNQKRLDKQDKVNSKRRKKAIKKGKEYYRIKNVTLKDTVNPKKIFSEWIKYTMGEPPVILDTSLVRKTDRQLELFLQKKGYYFGRITDTTIYDSLKQKAKVLYDVYPGDPFTIDSIYIDLASAKDTQWGIMAWLKGKTTQSHDQTKLEKGVPLDADMLNNERNLMTKYMREQGFYGFYPEHIYFEIDTFKTTLTADVVIKVKPRMVKNEQYTDSIDLIDHKIYTMRQVHFHMYEPPNPGDPVKHIDTLVYTVKERKKEPYDIIFYLDDKPYVKPKIIAYQSFLEPGSYYKSNYTERTYRRIQALGVFRSVNLKIEESQGDSLDAHFYLLNGKRQSFKIEPRGTYSNGFIGLSATMGYTNKNLFHGAEKFTFSITGGFESQPTILDDGSKDQLFNTWEIGPTISLEVPGLLPIPYLTFGKRSFPITIYSIAYNHQERPDFKRDLFQLSWLYRWSPSDPKQMFNSGFPLINNIKYVQIDKSPEFEKRLIELNDLFLLSSYSDQFIWEDFRLGWTFNNAQQTKSKFVTYYNIGFNTAGYFLEGATLLDSKIKGEDPDTIPKVFGVPYSKFLRLDNEFRLYHNFKKGMSMNYRAMAGVGWPDPGGNIQKALPYDYSFYAGGASDNRGWVSRTLGPGSYQSYADTSRTQTQIGDIRLLLTVEYRFDIFKYLKGALFADASNVWTFYNDPNRPGGQFGKDFYKEFAINIGAGLRLDFDFFQVRLDLGFPIYDPSMPAGERWASSPGTQFKNIIEDTWQYKYGDESYDVILRNENIRKPFYPRFNLGIGYPF